MNRYRAAADALTGIRGLAAVALAVRPSLAIALFAVATDWVDGAVARRGGRASYGPRFDLEADSLLTLGAAVAAVRRGAPSIALLPPLARYALVAARDPRTLGPEEILWDRVTGAAQMAVLIAALAPWPFRALLELAVPVVTVRCVAMAAIARNAAKRDLAAALDFSVIRRPAEARLVQTPGAGAPVGR